MRVTVANTLNREPACDRSYQTINSTEFMQIEKIPFVTDSTKLRN